MAPSPHWVAMRPDLGALEVSANHWANFAQWPTQSFSQTLYVGLSFVGVPAFQDL